MFQCKLVLKASAHFTTRGRTTPWVVLWQRTKVRTQGGGGGWRNPPPFGSKNFFFFFFVRDVGNVRWIPLLRVWGKKKKLRKEKKSVRAPLPAHMPLLWRMCKVIMDACLPVMWLTRGSSREDLTCQISTIGRGPRSCILYLFSICSCSMWCPLARTPDCETLSHTTSQSCSVQRPLHTTTQ